VNVESLFWELASRDRMNIVKALERGRRRLSWIAEEVGESVQETHRNLSRLSRAGLVDKDGEGYYVLTAFGRYVLAVLPTLEFLCEHRSYFESHDLSRIPLKFVYRIGELSGSRRAPDTLTAIRYSEIIIEESEDYVWIIAEQVLASAAQLASRKISEGVSLRVVVPRGLKPPPGVDLASLRNVDVRLIDSVDAALVLNEERACLAFPRLDGEMDYRGFLVESKTGHEWCKDLFEYYWGRGCLV